MLSVAVNESSVTPATVLAAGVTVVFTMSPAPLSFMISPCVAIICFCAATILVVSPMTKLTA